MVTAREQLSAKLKETRLAAGIDSQGKMAKALNLSRTSVVKAESPTGPVPSDAVLAAWSKVTGCDLAELMELAERVKSGTPEWFGPYLSAEQSATRLRFWAPAIFPGLLQPESYARAIEKSDAVVSHRLERQRQVLGRAQVTAAIDHRAFVHAIGSAAIMAEACGHLVKLAESEVISLHVVPEGANQGLGGHVAIASRGGHFTLALGTLVQDLTTTEATMVEKTLAAYDRLLGASLPEVQSVEYARQSETRWKEKT